MIGRRLLILLLLTFAGLLPLADAAAPLRAAVNELAPRPRGSAPEWIEVVLSSRSTAIREGSLELAMTEWESPSYRFRTHDLVINSGEQRFRFLLPAASASGVNSNRTVRLRFIEKDETTLLGDFPLGFSQRTGTAQVIAVVRPAFRSGSQTHPMWQALRIERIAPAERAIFDTTPLFIDVEDMPIDPLGFFPFDIVLIEPDALAGIREKAWKALAQWLNAGGSLCIVATSPLEAEQLEAINQLASVDPQWKPLTTDASGRVEVPEKMAFARVNFGRMAVTTELPPENVEESSPAWRKATTFLWKVVSGKAAQVDRNGKWSTKVEKSGPRSEQQKERVTRARRSSNWTGLDAPVWEVFPKDVQVVPVWILVALIVVFLVLIGPADWFILGALRRHRWTWLTFPLVAILVTGGTVLMVRLFMGNADRASAVIISDIGTNGRVIRETRVQLDLPASQKMATTPVRNALRLPLRASSRWMARGSAQWSELTFSGQFPGRYDYTRPQRQWSPEISRITSVVDAPDTSGIKWDAFNADFLSTHKVAFEALESLESPERVYARKFDRLAEKAGGLDTRKSAALTFFTKWGIRDTGTRPTDASWRHAITLVDPEIDGAIFTHVSPNGFPRTNDLKILEWQDPSRTVVVAVESDEETIHVWRRLYLH